jgi:CheY-like chemotaxis protein
MGRILIVEDNPLNRKLAMVILRPEGHEILTASDAEEAERIIEAGVPDLILMDLGLPGKDGYEFTRLLRHRSATKHIPIVAVTAFAMKGDRERALEAGCTDYLTKPIRRDALLECVRGFLPAGGGNLNQAAP